MADGLDGLTGGRTAGPLTTAARCAGHHASTRVCSGERVFEDRLRATSYVGTPYWAAPPTSSLESLHTLFQSSRYVHAFAGGMTNEWGMIARKRGMIPYDTPEYLRRTLLHSGYQCRRMDLQYVHTMCVRCRCAVRVRVRDLGVAYSAHCASIVPNAAMRVHSAVQ